MNKRLTLLWLECEYSLKHVVTRTRTQARASYARKIREALLEYREVIDKQEDLISRLTKNSE